jgi:predicted nucleotidyltransferase
MIYAVDEIARIVRPIAQRYGLRAVYLFGSYARGAATEDSDIDLLIDTTGTNIKSLLQVAAVYCELEEALGKPVVTVSSLEQEARMPSEESFRKAVWKEKVDIYVAA